MLPIRLLQELKEDILKSTIFHGEIVSAGAMPEAGIFGVGTTTVSDATIGAVSILGIEASTNQAIAGLIPNKKKIIPEYLMYYLYTLKPYYVQKSRGVAQNNINLTILKDVKIKVPKIDIQKEICSKINERKKLLIELEERKKESEEIIRNIMNELGLLF